MDSRACGERPEASRTVSLLGKMKLVLLLEEEGSQASASTVGRILKSLKTRDFLRELERTEKVTLTKSKRNYRRPYAEWKPRDYEVNCRRSYLPLCLCLSTPRLQQTQRGGSWRSFSMRAIQCDGGSEFYGAFEEACQEYGLKLFVLPPRSPISVE